MKRLLFYIYAVFVVVTLASCGEATEKDIAERVDSFAVHYFNWQYEKCLPYVTTDSKKFLEMEATNVTEGNVELLRSAGKDATVEINGIKITDDSNAVAKLSIHDFLAADTIGCPAKFHKSGTAEINVIKQGDNWYVVLENGGVRMAFRQQSVQPNHVQGQDGK